MLRRTPVIIVSLVTALTVPAPARPCSSFAGNRGTDLVFGTNYDNGWAQGHLYINARHVRKSGWERGTTGRVAVWTARYGSVTVSPIGPQLPTTGMNEAGLVFSSMRLADTAPPPPDARPVLAGPLWWQYVLDMCATIDDLKKAVEDVRINDTENHYLVCDRSGACAVVECRLGKVRIIDGSALPVKALTNAAYDKCLARFQQEGPWLAARYHSISRFSRLAAGTPTLANEDPPAAVERAFHLLADVASRTNTRWSVVLDSGRRVFHLTTDRNRKKRHIDLEKIDFTATTPVAVLDVHADLEGDITSRFRPYRHEEFEAHVLRALSHFRPGRSRRSVLDHLAHLEHFEIEPARK